jgi:hypothetical protein
LLCAAVAAAAGTFPIGNQRPANPWSIVPRLLAGCLFVFPPPLYTGRRTLHTLDCRWTDSGERERERERGDYTWQVQLKYSGPDGRGEIDLPPVFFSFFLSLFSHSNRVVYTHDGNKKREALHSPCCISTHVVLDFHYSPSSSSS